MCLSKEDNEKQNSEEDDIYTKYSFFRRPQSESNLPIQSVKCEILNKLERHQAIVIDAHTGSGKSTQVVDHHLKAFFEK